MKNCIFALLLISAFAFILPSPTSVDDLSVQLL